MREAGLEPAVEGSNVCWIPQKTPFLRSNHALSCMSMSEHIRKYVYMYTCVFRSFFD